MDGASGTKQMAKGIWRAIPDNALKVIASPRAFFRGMPKTGGFAEPMVFLVVMSAIAGVIRAILGLFHLGMVASTAGALFSIVLLPAFALICGFVIAFVLFDIWRLMGSAKPFETAYRCAAYTTAITPISAALLVIPRVGNLIGLAWGVFLLATASVEVHKIAAKTAWLVFGIIGAVLVLVAIW